MKALVVYDSVYGNTEKIARAIAGALGKPGEVKAVKPVEANPAGLSSLELLVVGSPVQGGRATKAVQAWLGAIPKGGLKDVRVATFDTRMKHFVATLMGYAGDRLARALKEKGASLVGNPGGFIVKGKEGPLLEGEIERAAAWAKGLLRA
jgi:flavodoxin